MHVALLHEYFVPHAPGGAEWSTLALAQRLEERGVRVSIITLDLADHDTMDETERIDTELAAQHILVHRLPCRRKMRGAPHVFPSYVLGNPVTEWQLARGLRRELIRIRPDVLHVQGLGMLTPARQVGRELDLPVLFTVRDFRPLCPAGICLHQNELAGAHANRAEFRACAKEYLRVYESSMPAAARVRYFLRREIEWSARRRQVRAFRDIEGAVFVSDGVRRIYEAAKLRARRNVVVHNLPASDDKGVAPAALRQRWNLGGPLALFVGRWSLGKGAEEMSRAWRQIHAAHPEAQLVIVGRREAKQVPEHEGMIFTGPLPHAEVLGLMTLADVFVLPSRWPEPYARTALEAMAAGTPVVATDAGGNRELVDDGRTGFIVPHGDADALAAAVIRLLGDDRLARRLGAAGQKKLAAATEEPLQTLVELYEEVAHPASPLRICAPATSLSEQTTLGGGYFHVKNLQALADRGARCTIPLAFGVEHEAHKNWDVRVVPIRRTFKLGALVSNIVFFGAVMWLCWGRRRRFDLLRVGDLYHMGPGLVFAARLCGLPTIGVIHHIDHDRRRENAIVGWTARRLDGILVPSRATADDVAATFNVDPSRLHRIVEGASTFAEKTCPKNEAKRRFDLDGKQVVGFVGGLHPRKNVAFLLRAFARLVADFPQARLLIVGEGEQREELESLARALGVAERATFTGRLFSADKAVALAAMDVFAFPSLNEGFGLAVVEAMAAGVPPIVSDRGSLPEIVHHEKTGVVCPVDDADTFAVAIGGLLYDTDRRRRLGAAAKRYVGEHFTWKNSAAQTEAAMRRVLEHLHGAELGVLLNSGDSLAAMRREGQEGRFVGHYLQRYARAFDRVHVFSYGDDHAQPYDNTSFVPGRRMKGPLYAALMPLLHEPLFRRLRLLRVMQTGAALPAILARVLFGTRYVTTYGYRYGDFMRVKGRWLYGFYLDILERVALRLAEKVIVTTPSLEEYVQQIVVASKIVCIPNGVDLTQFQPADGGRRDGKRVALFVGRLTEQKNLPLLLGALAPLRDRVRLVIAGEGDQQAVLMALAARLELNVELRGVVAHADLPALHRTADLFVLPSRIEGHPKALVEAMASGLPCVGTDAPGIRDVIDDGVNGLLAAPTEAALREAIKRVLDDELLATHLARGARRTAEAKYDLGRLLDREIDLLLQVAEGAKR